LLASLHAQDFREPFEIILVTEGESPLQDELKRRYPAARLFSCPAGSMPGEKRNRGMDVARGGMLLFTDADCVAKPDWVRLMVESCRRQNGGPVCSWISNPFGAVMASSDLAERGMLRPARPTFIPGLWGGGLCVGRSLVMTRGARFAEGVFGSEETPLVQRLPAESLPVLLEPAAEVVHLRRSDFMQALRRMYSLGKGSALVRRRYAIRGSAFTDYPVLIPLLLPARFLLCAARCARGGWRAAWTFLRLSPLVLCNLAFYTAGFAGGRLATLPAGQEVSR
jgi:glycosyltransferase involved in cell wall biosynthesis